MSGVVTAFRSLQLRFVKPRQFIGSHRSAYSTAAESNDKRSELFTEEKNRQHDNVGRIEKIEVQYIGLPEDTKLMMNKMISTPYNCAQHLSETHCTNSSLALINSKIPWDIHRPLEESCTLQLLNFTVSDPHIVNKAFWRTCSFLLGAALTECFKPEAYMNLHSFPSPNVKSGSFVHDISLGESNWKPNIRELRAISAEMIKLAAKNLPIERLDIDHDLALKMFEHSPIKREQLPSISNRNSGIVTVYRVGNHVDISKGPMIGFTGQLGKCTIGAVHEIHSDNQSMPLYRVQGVALPTGIMLNHFAYGILEERAQKLNPARLPNEPFDENISVVEATSTA